MSLPDRPDFPLPEGLERKLKGARADVGDAARLARIADRLGAEIASAPPPPARVPVRLLVAGLVLAGVAAVAIHRAASPAPSVPHDEVRVAAPTTPAPSSSVTESTPAPSAVVVEPAVSDLPAARVPPHARPLAPSAPASVVPSSPPAPPVDPVVEEHQLLAPARRALDANPQETLDRVKEHEARFPNGMLTSERELLRILALVRLGRLPEARVARDAFIARWPTSAYRGELERQLPR